MATNSDHKTPQFDINQVLPDVYTSEIGQSIFEVAFNRHLTKDDTVYVSGFVGTKPPNSTSNRQLVEPNPHRQAYQLAPTMYTKIGTVENSLSFAAFMRQLQMMGVNTTDYPVWGNTLQFNWAPPVNIDMLINYPDYFWTATNNREKPQHFTIENRCNKAKSKVNSYQNILNQRGSLFPVSSVDPMLNSMTINTKLDDIFVPGFKFYTKNANNVIFQGVYWTVSSSSYNISNDITTIDVVELFAIHSPTAPPMGDYIGQWWINPTNSMLSEWTVSGWSPTSTDVTADASLTELLDIYKQQAECACATVEGSSTGFDTTQWDDNQEGDILWNTDLITQISHNTESAWIVANNMTVHHPLSAPQPLDLWYDTSIDTLKQRDANNNTWVSTVTNFSTTLAQTHGNSFWDQITTCIPQQMNQWSLNNKWIHKTEVQSSTAVKRAQLPIIEYDSRLELSSWTKYKYSWKYRSNVNGAFSVSNSSPSRFELEPIKGYAVIVATNSISLYLHDVSQGVNGNIDYTNTFIPGFKFIITDDTSALSVYTVASSEFRELTQSEVNAHPANLPLNTLVTVLTISETVFSSPGNGGGVLNTRIVPSITSKGDYWVGYHAHWVLDVANTETQPSAPQQYDIRRQQSLNATVQYTQTSQGELFVGISHQELTVSIPTVTSIDIASSLTYNMSSSHPHAVLGSNDLRVYVNDVRQYGTYVEESTSTERPNYTVIGSMSNNLAPPIKCVNRITFRNPLHVADIVRIEVGPASKEDMGLESIPVRTLEDESEFVSSMVTGAQPVYMSLTQYKQTEQTQNTFNQYPLFNTYDVITGDIFKASNIFGFVEDPDYPVDPVVSKRIVSSVDGKEYQFQQQLYDDITSMLYGYRLIEPATTTTYGLSQTWWYNPSTHLLQSWDGSAWTKKPLIRITSTQHAIRTPYVGTTPPLSPLACDIWYNPSTNTMRVWNSTISQWIFPIIQVHVGADPTLHTIWKHGTNMEQFVPQYVDSERNPTTINSDEGSWQVPDQWMFNSEHDNKSKILMSEISTHFRSIISKQDKIPGLQNGGFFTLSQEDVNYGVGGTIKDHNDSFDTLISAVNVSNITPTSVVDFACNEYDSNLLMVRDLFNRMVSELFMNHSTQSIVDFTSYVADTVITRYQRNSTQSHIYGDTSSYVVNEQTGEKLGVENWIATVPMFGLGPKYVPHLNIDNKLNLVELYHHDGHRSRVDVSIAEFDNYARSAIGTPDARSTTGTLGLASSQLPPATEQAFSVAFNGSNVLKSMYPGALWYTHSSAVRELYRFELYALTSSHPQANQSTVPAGTQYFNVAESLTYTLTYNNLSQAVWTPTTGIPHDISTLWKPVDIRLLIANIYLEIEQRLYSSIPVLDQAFDYDSLITNNHDQNEYNRLMERQFASYLVTENINAPFTNTSYIPTNPFTWNYILCNVINPPKNASPPSASAWQELYNRWYNTPYPHLEPWKLQGYTDKPTWWDNEYAETNESRRWKYNHTMGVGMWENIRTGVVPAGHSYPNGLISTGNATADGVYIPLYNYFSVNISDNVIIGGYGPDDILPPYFDVAPISAQLPTVRSLFTNFNVEIIAPGADYAVGDVGPNEWMWLNSTYRVYDNLVVAFLMQPVRFLHSSFGLNFVTVDGLQVGVDTGSVPSHRAVKFHGDLYNTNQAFHARGLNQWYVNFNRYTGYDTNAQFRHNWVNWTPLLTYQSASILDTNSFEISNARTKIVEQDYNIVLANGGVLYDVWVDAFKISVLSIPPSIMQYNNQNLWKLELSTLSTATRPIYYYDVNMCDFVVNTTTGLIYTNRYNIINVNASVRQIQVVGNVTRSFSRGQSFEISQSQTNIGTHTVVSSRYDPYTDTTYITTVEPLVNSGMDGVIDLNDEEATWVTGSSVVFSSSKLLPQPLVPNTPYYLIRVDVNQYKVAESYNDSQTNLPVVFTTTGIGNSSVAEISSSFTVFNGVSHSTEIWYHYVLNKSKVLTMVPPYSFYGIQTLVNIIDGYVEKQKETGILYSVSDGPEGVEVDRDAGRPVSWQVELESFIDWAYGVRRTKLHISDRFEITANMSDSTFAFQGTIPSWPTGTRVMLSSTGTLPSPIQSTSTYYVQQTNTPGTIQLSTTPRVFDPLSVVTITSLGHGSMFISVQDNVKVFPTYELNPVKNNIWLSTPAGMLSNVVNGPYSDIRVQQTIFNQNGTSLTESDVMVYRSDKRAHITTRIPNGKIRLGGGHFFVESYEHYLIFDSYTAEGVLLYDAFLGLMAPRFNVEYNKKRDYTFRPTLGGYYLLDQKFFRNMEGVTEDMRNYYSASHPVASNDLANFARDAVGYKGSQEFLSLINIKPDAQFNFYRGMIQSKGSVNSVKAYTNSRMFVDAKLDEFWAWKVATFGDRRARIYPEIKLFATDGLVDDIRFEFTPLRELLAGSSHLVVGGYDVPTFGTSPYDAPLIEIEE